MTTALLFVTYFTTAAIPAPGCTLGLIATIVSLMALGVVCLYLFTYTVYLRRMLYGKTFTNEHLAAASLDTYHSHCWDSDYLYVIYSCPCRYLLCYC